VTPRAYNLGQRQVAADETRRKIVAAARELLADEHGPPDFTVDAVARQAGVARMTVYHQFGSKRGVLEALFDNLANRGLMPHLRPVFHEPDATRALDGLIAAFTAFWDSDRIVLRRARALAALDREIAESVRARDEMRRQHLRNILARLEPAHALSGKQLTDTVDVLHTLTSFESYDLLLRDGRSRDSVTRIIRHLAAATLHLPRSKARPRERSESS
jgi:AcrR family transcriptional regulator